jgi:hypothetical protein
MAQLCRCCSSSARQQIDAMLLAGDSTHAVAAAFGIPQPSVLRHVQNHLRPQARCIAKALTPFITPKPKPVPTAAAMAASLIPSVTSLLVDFGNVVEQLKVLVADAHADGNLAARTATLRELRSGLTDATKLIAALAPAPELPAAAIDAGVFAELLEEVGAGDRDELLGLLQ